jgi:hypothetical protein
MNGLEWRRGAQVYRMITTTAGKPAENGERVAAPRGGVDVVVPVEVDGWALYVGGAATGLHVADYNVLEQAVKCGAAGAWGAPGRGAVALWGYLVAPPREGADDVVGDGQRVAEWCFATTVDSLPWRDGAQAVISAVRAAGVDLSAGAG